MRYYLKWLTTILVAGLAAGAVCGETPDGPPAVEDGEHAYVTLRELAAFYHLRRTEYAGTGWGLLPVARLLRRAPDTRPIRLERAGTALTCAPGSRRLELNGNVVWLNAPVRLVGRSWALDQTDVQRVVAPLLQEEAYLVKQGSEVIVLDAGHGGKDRGGVSPSGALEKDLVLDIARRARVLLANAGLRVRLTRENDRALDLADRCRLAAKWKADLFVSIHGNVAGNPDARGVETYVLPAPGYPSTSDQGAGESSEAHPGNAFDGRSMILGYAIQKRLLERLGAEDRGVRQARFVVLREAPCPAALVECGFLTHTEEAARLGTPAYREDIARALSRGILDVVAAAQRAKVREP